MANVVPVAGLAVVIGRKMANDRAPSAAATNYKQEEQQC